MPLQTRVYEKLRFTRTRQSQLNGEDVRDRWHNALRRVDEGQEINPEDVKIRNRWLYSFDAEADTMKNWPETSSIVAKELARQEIRPLFTNEAERVPRMINEAILQPGLQVGA